MWKVFLIPGHPLLFTMQAASQKQSKNVEVQKIMLPKQDAFNAGHLLAWENQVAYFFPSP